MYKKEGPKKNHQQGWIVRGRKTNSPPPPKVTRSILDKERGQTLEKTFSLKEPSPTIITCVKIEVTCVHCNANDTFCL
jgi:hypothetical protein